MRPPSLPRCYDTLVCRLFCYDDIAAHLSARIEQYCPGAHAVLDLACGTGNLTLPLARLGYQVTGVDHSEDMLTVAREKAAPDSVDFVRQDMRQPYTGQPVDAVTCFYGGLNYLDSLDQVRNAFKRAHAALVPGGILVFDQLSNAAMHTEFAGIKAVDLADFYVITQGQHNVTGRIDRKVTYFIREQDGRYRREGELERLYIHPFPGLVQALHDTGFELCALESLYPQIDNEAMQDMFLFIARRPFQAQAASGSTS